VFGKKRKDFICHGCQHVVAGDPAKIVRKEGRLYGGILGYEIYCLDCAPSYDSIDENGYLYRSVEVDIGGNPRGYHSAIECMNRNYYVVGMTPNEEMTRSESGTAVEPKPKKKSTGKRGK